MKKKLLSKVMLLLFALVAGSSSVWAQTWKKASSIQAGDIVVFVTEGATKELSSFSATSTVYGIGTSYTTTPVGTYPFTVVAGNSEGTFAFQHGSDYLYWTSGNSLNVNSTLSDNTSWKVTFSDGNAILKNAADDSRQIWWNVSNPRFACYTGKSAGTSYYSIQIYKQTSSSYTVNYNGNGNTGGTAPTDNNTYSSGATVTVLDNTGSLVKAGSSFGGWNTRADGEGTNYAAGATFTITANTTLYAKWNPYSITAVSNNVDYGTVSLVGTTITATPNSGYRVSTSTPYGISPVGSATVERSGNVFTITPSANTTITINFESTPTRTVSVTPSDDGTVTVKNGEDPVASGSSVYEGTELTITAAPGAGKVFVRWDLTDATPADEDATTTTFTVGASDVTVEAVFDDAITHAISWSVNGNVIKTENVVEGESIDLSAPASGVPTGFTFIGWRTSTLALTDTDPDDYVTSATSTTDITYYATLATLSAVNDVLNCEWTDVEGNSYVDWYSKSGSSGAIYAGNSANYSNYAAIQLRSNNSNSGIVTTTSGGNARKVIVEWNSNTQAGRTLDIYGNNTAYSAASELYGSSTQGTKLGSIIYGTSTELTIPAGYEYIGLRSSSGAMYLNKITIVWGDYDGYCTTIPPYSRYVTGGKWGTLCLEFDATVEGATLYTFEGVDNTTTPTTAYFEETASASVEGGKPYFFKATGSTLTATYTPGVAKAAVNVNGAVGTLTDIDVAEGMYLLSNNELVKCGTGCTLAAYRAYIDMSTASVYSGGGSLVKMAVDMTDGIATLRNVESETNVYDLSGRRVSKATKGIYIVNGKKVVK